MPFFSTPCGIGNTLIGKSEFQIHIHFGFKAGKKQCFSPLFSFPADILIHNRPCKTLSAIFGKYVKTEEHYAFSFRVVQGDIGEELIAESLLIGRHAV